MAGFNFFQKPAAQKPAATKQAAPAADPLEAFKGIWEALSKQQEEASKNKGGVPQLDAKQLSEALSKTRIAPQATQQQMEAISQGGESALQAVAEMLNQTAQASTMQAIMASQRMVQAAVESSQASMQADLPNQLRDQLFQQQLATKLPNLSNPAVSPMVEMVRAGIAASNPSLTSEQLTEQAAQFFTEFGKGLVPEGATGTDGAPEAEPAQDFFKILGISVPPESGTQEDATT